MNRQALINGWYIVAAILAAWVIQNWRIGSQQVKAVPCSAFEPTVNAGKIKSVRVTDKYITGTMGRTGYRGSRRLAT